MSNAFDWEREDKAMQAILDNQYPDSDAIAELERNAQAETDAYLEAQERKLDTLMEEVTEDIYAALEDGYRRIGDILGLTAYGDLAAKAIKQFEADRK